MGRALSGGIGAGSEGAPARQPSRGGPWVLLPVAWCVWLLVWLGPSHILAPRLAVAPWWMARGTAPTALWAGAVLFLVGFWPFWSALGMSSEGESGGPSRWVGRFLVELVILAALAAPFTLVAWSVGGRRPEPGRLALAGGVVALLGAAIRVADLALGDRAGRHLATGAMLVCIGPLLVAYAVGETMAIDFEHVADLSPMVSGVRLALGGWPHRAWLVFTDVVLWPGAAVVLALVSLSERGRRRRRGYAD